MPAIAMIGLLGAIQRTRKRNSIARRISQKRDEIADFYVALQYEASHIAAGLANSHAARIRFPSELPPSTEDRPC